MRPGCFEYVRVRYFHGIYGRIFDDVFLHDLALRDCNVGLVYKLTSISRFALVPALPGRGALHLLRVAVFIDVLLDLLTVVFKFPVTYWYFVDVIPTFPAGVRKNPFGLHLLVIRPLQLQPPGLSLRDFGVCCGIVVTFVLVIALTLTLPAGVRKNPIWDFTFW